MPFTGVYTADSGTSCVDGKETEIGSIKKSHVLGISVIHQEIILVPHMTIAEKFFLVTFGIWRHESGTIFVNGAELKIKKPEDAIRAGVGLVPESRKEK